MIDLKPGDVLQVTAACSVQFVRPIMFRLIKVRADLITYDGWVWLDGYELDAQGDAVARRELFVVQEGIRRMEPSARRTLPPRGRPPGSRGLG